MSFTVQSLFGLMLGPQLSEPFHFELGGRCNGEDVQHNEIVTL